MPEDFLNYLELEIGDSIDMINFTQTIYSAPSHALLKDVMVPMRDGIRLATDIYLPTDPNTSKLLKGPFPAVLIRSPYKKTRRTETSMALRLVEKEYAIIIQDVRGRHNSEGEFYAFLGEGKDGYDAVEWVAAQPWCNGNVGTWGASYLAITQSALAAYAPPHLKTMFVIVGPSDCSEEYIAHGGAVCLLHSTWYSYWMAQTGKRSPV